ncbi:MAG: cation transporter [Acidimicrobiia bacterium]|nr:cation transporter [Acidimicrobiia bacterium]
MTRELRLRLVLALNLVLATGLVVAGVVAQSLGLFAAAGDTATDVGAVLLSLLAVRMARRAPTAQRSFGYHRSTILAAQANAAVTLVVSGVIAIEAIRRLQDPPTVHGGAVLVVAGIAAVANTLAALALAADHHDLNMRVVLVHTAGDAAANAGVALAGAAILATGGYEWLDPAVSLVIAVVIAVRSVHLLLQATDVLLESTPSGLDLGELASAITAIDGVDEVHDIHVWSLSSEVRAMSAHLVLSGHPTLEEAQVVGDRVRATIGPRFGIAHATLELECEACVQEDGEPCAELLDGPTATSGTSGLLRRHA